MAINIKAVTAKNFLSIGNLTQAVSLDQNNLTLILGANLDLGGEDNGSKNGVGKCISPNTKVKIRDTITGQVSEVSIEDLYNLALGNNNN